MQTSVWYGKTILVTGGTGSFGKAFISTLLKSTAARKVIVFSRDELKQHEMATGGFSDDRLRFFIGDVRDRDRLKRAMNGVNIVVHAAALKQVPACEYNPIEAIRTNIDGARNVTETALDAGVNRVLALSTDKAVNPVNLYGATKLVAEKLFVQANAYSGSSPTRFSCVRYGNVVGSRGSVVPLFQMQRESGVVTVTDTRMTRFWLTLDQGVRFVMNAVSRMHGGEVFVPKIPSMKILDLVDAIAPGCKVREIGIRPGEKLHEVLLSEDEARTTIELEDTFQVCPSHPFWDAGSVPLEGKALPDGFLYASNTNSSWLTAQDLCRLVGTSVHAAVR